MILIGLPCDYCHSVTVSHCTDAACKWSRCPRCHSYGVPGGKFVQWNKDDYVNPYSLYDVKTVEPQRTMPMWLDEDYGTRRSLDEKW